jgi:hypothetical protein
MHTFNGQIEDLLSMLVGQDPNAQTQVVPQDDSSDPFIMFKEFTVDYVQEHDELPSDHPVIGQIINLNSVDEIENILRQNLDYCDDCVLKLFRKFAAGAPEGACGCPGACSAHAPEGE